MKKRVNLLMGGYNLTDNSDSIPTILRLEAENSCTSYSTTQHSVDAGSRFGSISPSRDHVATVAPRNIL